MLLVLQNYSVKYSENLWLRHDLGCWYVPAGVVNHREFFGCGLKEKLEKKQHFGWIRSAHSGVDGWED